MLIRSLKQHFPARLPEWLMSGVMATWGAQVILHPEMFTRPETRALFAGLADLVDWTGYHPGSVWGLAAVIVGLLRASALFINGAYARTPVVRLVASFISAFIWTQVVLGLVKASIPNTGLAVYPWFVVADLASAYRASLDAVLAEHNRIRSGDGHGALAGGC